MKNLSVIDDPEVPISFAAWCFESIKRTVVVTIYVESEKQRLEIQTGFFYGRSRCYFFSNCLFCVILTPLPEGYRAGRELVIENPDGRLVGRILKQVEFADHLCIERVH